ncbi:oxidoreductase [Streptomyces viridochromogenes]|uniref:Oxidoreductase n=1 Tax=Streptomyces viridochromogenes TaxID=1938 RepID=A0A0J8C675_STRVR|nr:Gfo/Idh/MocA family oxidoreductase [Streptomyces viridochromogenes]KMS73380.1 oxidoreductase [Streptomyces viridochromogenes]KOG24356.1 oxidoreductase [Streptomyces viridochromogenes]KOG25461.1 oxidoreductase [Streptomyces viridochromogenes]
MSSKRVGVGVIGAGVISRYYLENMTRFPDLNVLAVADLDPARARVRAQEFGLRPMLLHELLGSEDIQIVLNLTVPAAHFDVSARILVSGKHVWSEKPLATSRRDARLLLDKAARRGLRVACAPDTFLGGALQTAQRAVLAGRIGEPKSALAIMQAPGPEGTHPNPAFYFDDGGGPLLDMGPYHVTALVQTLGAVHRVSAVSSTARAVRRVLVGECAGTEFDVRVPTQHMALLEFASGARATLLTSFDSGIRRDLLELHGTEASLVVPDPNRFEGTGTFAPFHAPAQDVPAVGSTWGRGVGVLELARSIRAEVPERASGALAYHVLDVLLAIREAARAGTPVTIESTAASPAPLDESWDPTAATL